MIPSGDHLLTLLGKQFDDLLIREALARLDIPWKPVVSPGKPHDWISTGNLELGFDDFAWFHALDAAPRDAAPVLEQVCFYAPKASATRVIPAAFGIKFHWNRTAVRQHLALHVKAARFCRRDVFDLERRTLSVTYDEQSSQVDSVLVLAERRARPSRARSPIGFMALCECFGRPWNDPALRSHLSSLADSGTGIPQVDKHGTCNLIREAAIRLFFHQSEPGWIFTGCEIYRDRVRDACTWAGDMPYGLAFQDMPDEVSRKLGRKPEREVPGDLESVTSWLLGEHRLVVTFDLVVNLISSVKVRSNSWE